MVQEVEEEVYADTCTSERVLCRHVGANSRDEDWPRAEQTADLSRDLSARHLSTNTATLTDVLNVSNLLTIPRQELPTTPRTLFRR